MQVTGGSPGRTRRACQPWVHHDFSGRELVLTTCNHGKNGKRRISAVFSRPSKSVELLMRMANPHPKSTLKIRSSSLSIVVCRKKGLAEMFFGSLFTTRWGKPWGSPYTAGASYPCPESLDPHEARKAVGLASCKIMIQPGTKVWGWFMVKNYFFLKTARQCSFHREFQGGYVPVFARPLAFCFSTSWDWPTRPATSAQSPRKPTGCFPLRSIVT